MKNKFLYSVVIPVFNSEDIVLQTVLKVRKFFLECDLLFEIILVNDGSQDNSWTVVAELAQQHPEVLAVDLLKNYGQHHANLCGFCKANGDFIITMDDDLQNPPEEIGKLIERINDGYDLVMGKFETKRHSWLRRVGSTFVGWLNRKIFKAPQNIVLSNFRIIHREVIDRVCKDKSFSPYIPGLLLKYSYNPENVLLKHLPRSIGKSNYTIRKLLRLVAVILFNHSTIPLRVGSAFGFLASGFSIILSLYFLIQALIKGSSVPGWASIAVILSFFNGILILLISVIGEYVIRILREISVEQSYEIKQVIH